MILLEANHRVPRVISKVSIRRAAVIAQLIQTGLQFGHVAIHRSVGYGRPRTRIHLVRVFWLFRLLWFFRRLCPLVQDGPGLLSHHAVGNESVILLETNHRVPRIISKVAIRSATVVAQLIQTGLQPGHVAIHRSVGHGRPCAGIHPARVFWLFRLLRFFGLLCPLVQDGPGLLSHHAVSNESMILLEANHRVPRIISKVSIRRTAVIAQLIQTILQPGHVAIHRSVGYGRPRAGIHLIRIFWLYRFFWFLWFFGLLYFFIQRLPCKRTYHTICFQAAFLLKCQNLLLRHFSKNTIRGAAIITQLP